ncbi:hypothetical protein ACFQ61_08085 [Streptomyces sp. NPDC056500]|uniref:hypothetical protein n=1 Tax=Streptomyces sp. NPDC056500 TaxID=3345840 RepID=UPI00369A0C5D
MSVVGYTYQAETLCPSCTLKVLRVSGIKVQNGKPHEDAVRRAAQNLSIDFDDECSYDSDRFPKPITAQQCETELTELPEGELGRIPDERCTGDKCGRWLVLGVKSPTESHLARWLSDTYELPRSLARETAGKLREWGLSHSAFISEDNVRQAAAALPHEYATVHCVGNPQRLELRPSPEYDNDSCFYCELAWEQHRFVCEGCGATVRADIHHAHHVPVRGQISIPMVGAER